MATKVTYTYCELLRGLSQNTWLFLGEGRKLRQIADSSTEEECRDAYFRYKRVVEDRLRYWEGML